MIKHVYLISFDTLRFDCVPFQKDKSVLKRARVLQYLNTPTLNKLTKKTLNFSNAMSAAPYTSTSHATVFTGLYPPKHHVRALLNPLNHSLAKNVMTLAEVFESEGYQTVFASDEESMFRPLAIDRGFKHYLQNDDKKLVAFIKKNKKKKLFIFKHFFDIHDPYLLTRFEETKNINADYITLLKEKSRRKNIPIQKDDEYYKNWRSLFGGAKNTAEELFPLYVQGISKFDMGRLKTFIESMEKLGEFKESLFVFFADHGEGRCDSNNPHFFAHGGELYDDVVRVPLFMYHKSLRPGSNDALVSLADIFPTVISMAFGEKLPAFYPQYDLDGQLLSRNTKGHEYIYAEMWRSNIEHPQDYPTNQNWMLCQRAIRTNIGKCIIKGKVDYFFELPKTVRQSALDEAIKRSILCSFEKLPKNDIFVSRDEALTQVQNALEKIEKPLITFFDLVKDPSENSGANMLKASNNLLYSVLLRYYLKRIFLVDSFSVNLSVEELEKCKILQLIYRLTFGRNFEVFKNKLYMIIYRLFEKKNTLRFNT